jgi:hypothetical protein
MFAQVSWGSNWGSERHLERLYADCSSAGPQLAKQRRKVDATTRAFTRRREDAFHHNRLCREHQPVQRHNRTTAALHNEIVEQRLAARCALDRQTRAWQSESVKRDFVERRSGNFRLDPESLPADSKDQRGGKILFGRALAWPHGGAQDREVDKDKEGQPAADEDEAPLQAEHHDSKAAAGQPLEGTDTEERASEPRFQSRFRRGGDPDQHQELAEASELVAQQRPASACGSSHTRTRASGSGHQRSASASARGDRGRSRNGSRASEPQEPCEFDAGLFERNYASPRARSRAKAAARSKAKAKLGWLRANRPDYTRGELRPPH